ncbi:salutaridinol 7-O-acetyltransferase-like [Tripterygium wilfordii]|uniref:salutaridinol 7-O-acetyltransferase-like n=1 Tax=Tripterygium wilfordii TaxID=458696 RepID=UPI0018F82397|nr:salutaridinol 7-O-acetyltransferase-like [Tripterygium wilfordii]
MEVEILSTECIKPSSPTPSHLKTYKLSLLDQFSPPVFLPLLVFVPANQASTSTKTLLVLKHSLSQTLSLYYPLAGTANDGLLSVDCNDEGISYVDARADCSLCGYLKQPLIISTLLNFLPDVTYTELTPGDHVAVIQGTLFSCGGIAIALVVPHNIFDAASLTTFMKSWAAIARDSSTAGALAPDFSAVSIFPQSSTPFPQDLTAASVTQHLLKGNKMSSKFVVRRFVFDGSAINNLKAKVMRSGVQNPTRVEVVFAVFLKSIISAKSTGGHAFASLATNAVSLRRKAVPPLSGNFVGNLVLMAAMLLLSQGDKDMELSNFVVRMREAVSTMVNSELVKSLEGDGRLKTLSKYAEELGELYSKAMAIGAEPILLNSWCNFGLYEADFGWGKPLWIPFVSANKSLPIFSIFLMDTKDGKGIEAWTNLDEQVLGLIEHDMELSSLASLDPNPLQICSPRSNL